MKAILMGVFVAVSMIATASAGSLATGKKAVVTPTCPSPQETSVPPGPVGPKGTGIEFDLRAPGGARPIESNQGEESPSPVDPGTVTIFPNPATKPSTNKESSHEKHCRP